MCTVWSSAEMGFSTKGLWKMWPCTSIVSSVSISVSSVSISVPLEGAGGRVEWKEVEGRQEKVGRMEKEEWDGGR